MELREAKGRRIRKTRLSFSDLLQKRLEKLDQTNGVCGVSLVAGEESTLEIGNGVREGDEGR